MNTTLFIITMHILVMHQKNEKNLLQASKFALTGPRTLKVHQFTFSSCECGTK